jgi:hypothetical protein
MIYKATMTTINKSHQLQTVLVGFAVSAALLKSNE